MKQFIPILLLLSVMLSCSKSPIEQSLEKYVVDRAEGIDVKYKLKDYHFIDTVTVQNMLDSLSIKLTFISCEPNIDDFKEKRDQEFKKFRDNDPDYEDKVMRGELKDASDWCTEIRKITERADSLIDNWEKVDRFSYDYNYLNWWYTKRQSEFYQFDYKLSSNIDEIFDMIQNSRSMFDLYNKLKYSPKDSIVNYVVSHTYSIFNPMVNSNIEKNDWVYFDSNLKYKSCVSKTNMTDLLKQFTE